VLGIVSVPTALIWFVSIPLGIIAIVMGSIARTDVRRHGYINSGQAKAGIILGIAGIVLAAGFVVAVGSVVAVGIANS
jgi:ABC-type microcin C transport system permease subunit YejB